MHIRHLTALAVVLAFLAACADTTSSTTAGKIAQLGSVNDEPFRGIVRLQCRGMAGMYPASFRLYESSDGVAKISYQVGQISGNAPVQLRKNGTMSFTTESKFGNADYELVVSGKGLTGSTAFGGGYYTYPVNATC